MRADFRWCKISIRDQPWDLRTRLRAGFDFDGTFAWRKTSAKNPSGEPATGLQDGWPGTTALRPVGVPRGREDKAKDHRKIQIRRHHVFHWKKSPWMTFHVTRETKSLVSKWFTRLSLDTQSNAPQVCRARARESHYTANTKDDDKWDIKGNPTP